VHGPHGPGLASSAISHQYNPGGQWHTSQSRLQGLVIQTVPAFQDSVYYPGDWIVLAKEKWGKLKRCSRQKGRMSYLELCISHGPVTKLLGPFSVGDIKADFVN
jgi:hypothetical protein